MSFYITATIVGLFLTIAFYCYMKPAAYHNDTHKIYVALAMFIAFFGFAMIVPATEDHYKFYTFLIENVTYAKTKSALLIELPDMFTQKFEDASTYNAIEKAQYVYDNRVINFYGFEIRRFISLNKKEK